MRPIIVLLLTLFLVLSGPALAKCPFVRYEVQGMLILPSEAGLVKVYLFLDQTTRPSDYPAEPGQNDYSVPDSGGSFRTVAWLNTSSGFSRLTGDKCGRIELGGDIFITGDRLQGRRLRVFFGRSKRQIRRELRAAVTLGDIQVQLLPGAPAGRLESRDWEQLTHWAH